MAIPFAGSMSYACGTSDVPLLGKCIGQVLMETAARVPSRDALIVCHEQQRFTYHELLPEVERAARALLSLGIAKGDRVGIWSTNCSQWVILQFAAASIGAILVNINPANRRREMEYVLRQSECQTLIFASGFRDVDYLSILHEICPDLACGECGSALPDLHHLIFLGGNAPAGTLAWDKLLQQGERVGREALEQRACQLDFDDPINIQYTSGTTGTPKGATLSHHNIVNNAYLIATVLRFTEQDRLCIPVPFYHCFGMVMANMACVLTGATMVVPAPYFDAGATLRAVAGERCTALYGVPTMFVAELQHPDFDRFDLKSLRTGIMAGSPCPVEVMKRVQTQMHCSEMTIAYGLTESSPVITQTSPEDPLERRVASVGKVLPHTEMKIVDPISGRTLARGEQGELCTRGYLVMKGYYKDPAATSAVIDVDGWLHTGDLAILDEEGYCTITGRAKDVIIRGGENVYPREIEEFLYTCPGICAAQVFGVPDSKYGERVGAWVAVQENSNLSPEQIRQFCQGRIARFKIPEIIKIVQEFPMTVTGKVQKFKIREAALKELARESAAAEPGAAS
jgi:fatty-acyl-CoA synthase